MDYPEVKKQWMIGAEEKHGLPIHQLLPAWFKTFGAEAAAKRLGVTRGTVYYWLKEWGYKPRRDLVKREAVVR